MKELSKLENDFVQALPFFMKQKKDLHIEYQVAIGFIYTIWPQPLIQNIAAVIGSLPKETVEGHLRYCYNTQAN